MGSTCKNTFSCSAPPRTRKNFSSQPNVQVSEFVLPVHRPTSLSWPSSRRASPPPWCHTAGSQGRAAKELLRSSSASRLYGQAPEFVPRATPPWPSSPPPTELTLCSSFSMPRVERSSFAGMHSRERISRFAHYGKGVHVLQSIRRAAGSRKCQTSCILHLRGVIRDLLEIIYCLFKDG
jgi:hypothetical protein